MVVGLHAVNIAYGVHGVHVGVLAHHVVHVHHGHLVHAGVHSEVAAGGFEAGVGLLVVVEVEVGLGGRGFEVHLFVRAFFGFRAFAVAAHDFSHFLLFRFLRGFE